MRCGDIESLSIKYELGELDFFQKKIFEYHLKKCPVCKKKYASLIVLGVLLFSSKKIYAPSVFKLLISSLIVKVFLVTIFSLSSIVGINEVYNVYKNRLTKNKDLIEKKIIKDLIKEKTYLKADEKPFIKKQEYNNDLIIRAVDNDKEIELRIDRNNFETKSRIEK